MKYQLTILIGRKKTQVINKCTVKISSILKNAVQDTMDQNVPLNVFILLMVINVKEFVNVTIKPVMFLQDAEF